MIELATKVSGLKLVTPDVNRDPLYAVKWLEGEAGRETLRRMGNTEEEIRPITLETEKERIQGFLDSKKTIIWTMSLDGKPVGAIWVDLEPTKYVPGPAVHIMIGDMSARGRGVGKGALLAVINYLRRTDDNQFVYSRYLTSNAIAGSLLSSAGFSDLGKPYDEKGLQWQNVVLK